MLSRLQTILLSVLLAVLVLVLVTPANNISRYAGRAGSFVTEKLGY